MAGVRNNLKSEKCYITMLVVGYGNISTVFFFFQNHRNKFYWFLVSIYVIFRFTSLQIFLFKAFISKFIDTRTLTGGTFVAVHNCEELLKLIELRIEASQGSMLSCQSLSCFSWHLYLEVSAGSHSCTPLLNDSFVGCQCHSKCRHSTKSLHVRIIGGEEFLFFK